MSLRAGVLDQPFGRGVATRNSEVRINIRIAWCVTFMALTTIVALVPGIENRWWTVAYLACNAPVQLMWHRIRPNGRVAMDRPVYDGISVLICTALSPALWFSGVLVFAMGVGNIGRERIPWRVGALLMAMGGGLAIIGSIHDQPSWLAVTLVAVVMLSIRSLVVNSVWQHVQRAEDDLFDVLKGIEAVVHMTDPATGCITWIAPNIERVMGYSDHEWMAMEPSDLVHPDDLANYLLTPDEVVEGRHWDRYARHRHRDGHWVWLHVVSTARIDLNGRLLLRGHYSDATNMMAARELIQRAARTDELTGLANRYVLLNEMADRLSRAQPSFSLLMLDVDRFKDINDTLGHDIGDEVLKELGARISTASDGTLVCRLGGDEFAVLIDDPVMVDEVAATIGARCATPMRVKGLTLSTEVSIGSVLVPQNGRTPKDILRHGDLAMYQAKRRRKLHVPFDPSMERNAATELKLSAGLGQSIDNGEFELFFQPKVDLATGRIVGAEGLARWRHPDLGLLQPKSFIHLMAISNAHARFTDAVVDQGARFAAAARQAAGQNLPVAINISLASLFDKEFPSRLHGALERHGVAPSQLVLEVTEDDIMEEFASISPVIAELAGMGMQLSIDDFGTGHSSLARLVDLPVCEIKIDSRFVASAVDHARERGVVHSMLDLAGRLDLVAVAEGVEDERQVEVLRELGCTVGQGYLFGRAVPGEELLRRIGYEGTGVLDPVVDVTDRAEVAAPLR